MFFSLFEKHWFHEKNILYSKACFFFQRSIYFDFDTVGLMSLSVLTQTTTKWLPHQLFSVKSNVCRFGETCLFFVFINQVLQFVSNRHYTIIEKYITNESTHIEIRSTEQINRYGKIINCTSKSWKDRLKKENRFEIQHVRWTGENSNLMFCVLSITRFTYVNYLDIQMKSISLKCVFIIVSRIHNSKAWHIEWM